MLFFVDFLSFIIYLIINHHSYNQIYIQTLKTFEQFKTKSAHNKRFFFVFEPYSSTLPLSSPFLHAISTKDLGNLIFQRIKYPFHALILSRCSLKREIDHSCFVFVCPQLLPIESCSLLKIGSDQMHGKMDFFKKQLAQTEKGNGVGQIYCQMVDFVICGYGSTCQASVAAIQNIDFDKQLKYDSMLIKYFHLGIVGFIIKYLPIDMDFIKKMKTYLNNQSNVEAPKNLNQIVSPRLTKQVSLSLAKKSNPKSQQSFQLLMLDILDNNNQQLITYSKPHKFKPTQSRHKSLNSEHNKEETIVSLHTDSSTESNNKVKEEEDNSDQFQDLVFEEDEHEQIENIYIKDFIFINKLEEARELTDEEWRLIIKEKNLAMVSKKNIYFSLFKGIKFEIRKDVWEVFANTQEMKKITFRTYSELIKPNAIPEPYLTQIDKDVPRSLSITKYTKQLRNILIAYCAFSKRQYVQGMNLIAGSLLTLLALENDEDLEEFEIYEEQFEERVFWVFIGVMVEKNWEQIFQKDFQGLNEKLKTLQSLMAEHTPAIYQKLIDFEWDLTIFSQFYITIMLYNSPINLSKIVLDLFFLEGENIIHSLIMRMLKLTEDKILGMADQCEMMSYLKKDMIFDCYNEIMKDRSKAKKLEDFKINFMKIGNPN